MLVMAKRCCTLLLMLVVCAACCASALADGDPASDFLLEDQVFLPAQSTQPATAAQRGLVSAVRAANEKGFQIRVAVIASSYDLGSVTQLWQKPQTYARFLGIELSLAYKGRLLVVMPNGFGFNWPGHPGAASEHALSQVPIPPGEAAEMDAATAAVRHLAAAGGVSLASAPRTGSRPGSGADVGWALAVGAALALTLVVALARLRRRARARPAAPRSTDVAPTAAANAAVAPATGLTPAAAAAFARGTGAMAPAAGGSDASRAPSRGRPRRSLYALATVGVLLVAAAAVPVIAASTGGRSTTHASSGQGEQGPEPAIAWPAGQRPAPGFQLVDQNGRRVSPSAYRGRPVLITFIDPLCRNLCPLEAHVINALDRSLPASKRPEIIAVSVDEWADKRADLMQDYSKWGLVPQWQWAVGAPAQLESVWRRYGVEVDVETKHIAGTTVHYIGHDEMAYLLDPRGYERALFVWPFDPADVRKTLRQLRISS
jgi:cytochrome oxidase Cu insertion factor (SCO1/SenC/PrrC family)